MKLWTSVLMLLPLCLGLTACANEEFVARSCDSSACVAPPPPLCQDVNNAVTYASAGFCTFQGCIYPHELTFCEFGCDLQLGECRDEPLQPEIDDDCDCPEDTAFCDEQVLVSELSLGCDDDGRCLTLFQEQDCQALDRACVEDACVEPESP